MVKREILGNKILEGLVDVGLYVMLINLGSVLWVIGMYLRSFR